MSETAPVYQHPATETATPLNDLLARPVGQHTAFDVLLDESKHDQIARTAKTFSQAQCVPSHFKGKPHDIFTVLCRAYSWNIDPLMALEQCYIVSGKLGVSAQLAIALANNSGKLAGPIDWQITGEGDSLEIEAFANLKDGRRIAASVGMKMAKAEGWAKNKKYETMPEHMLMYRAATFLIRRYLPEVLLGMSTADELRDVEASKGAPQEPISLEVDDDPPKPPEVKAITAQQKAFIEAAIGAFHIDRKKWKADHKIGSLSTLPAADFDDIRNKLLIAGAELVEAGIDAAKQINDVAHWGKAVSCLERSKYSEAGPLRTLYESKKAEYLNGDAK